MAKKRKPRPSPRNSITEGHPVWDALRDEQTAPDGRVWCPLCDRLWPREFSDEMDVDHIVPVSAGGSDAPDNLQLVCPSCNRIKQAKSQAEARALCLERRTMTAYEWGITAHARSVGKWARANPEKRREIYRRNKAKRAKRAPLSGQPQLE